MYKSVLKQDRRNTVIYKKTEIPIALVKQTEGYATPIFNTVLT